MDFLDLGMTLDGMEDNEDRNRVADIFSKAENAANEMCKAALAATELSRNAAAVCKDFVDTAAHGDVDSDAS